MHNIRKEVTKMTEVKIIYLTGRTGKKYRFYTFPDPDGLKAEGGIFAITRRYTNKNSWEHELIEIDVLHDMSELKKKMQMPGYNCHKGANCIAARLEKDPLKRKRVAEDLWGNYFPSMLSA
ncbi:MAG: hypothetical protein RQ761_06955 [Bacteroidales bacterium]|nr:hypothetical protein [Bacteroidales bacterium]